MWEKAFLILYVYRRDSLRFKPIRIQTHYDQEDANVFI